MNYLSLVQRLAIESGASGPAAGISTVANTSGEAARMCNWIKQAWIEIQEEHEEWEWMRRDVEFDTVIHQQAYLPAGAEAQLTDFARWKKESWRAYVTSVGVGSEMFVNDMPYNKFRDYYMFGTRRTTYGRPISVAVRPYDKALLLGPAPEQIYTMVGEYFTTVQELAADGDIPQMPDRFHMAIVYRAMIHYGMYDAAPEVVQRGENLYNEMLIRLEADQLPMIETASPLA